MSIFDTLSNANTTSPSSEMQALQTVYNYLQTLLAQMNTNSASMTSTINSKTTGGIVSASTATKFVIASASIPANTSVLLIPANANRKGFMIYNNSINSLYVCLENPAVASNLIDFCGTNAGPTSVIKWLGPVVYTGAIYGIRNAGVGNVTAWELT